VIDAARDSAPAAARGRGEPARVLDTLGALVESDLRARYGRGRGKLLKWLLDPFFATGVYLLLVAFVLDRGGEAPGLTIACATVPFQLVMMGVVSGLGSVPTRRSIVLNMRFDRALIPLASVLTETVAFAASLSLLAVLMAAYGVEPTAAIVWLVPALLVTVLMAVAMAYPCALLGVWMPELRPFVVSFARTFFFLSAGLIALAEVPESTARWLRLNPLTGLFEAYRDALVYGQRPAAWELAAPFVFSVVVLALTLPVWRREQAQLAKVVE
jgi:teichoic acid transport system permease protein